MRQASAGVLWARSLATCIEGVEFGDYYQHQLAEKPSFRDVLTTADYIGKLDEGVQSVFEVFPALQAEGARVLPDMIACKLLEGRLEREQIEFASTLQEGSLLPALMACSYETFELQLQTSLNFATRALLWIRRDLPQQM